MTTPGKRNLSTPRELTRIGNRLSFVYLERCVVHRDSNAITAEDAEGTTHIPSASIGTLLLGPGTRISHQAMAVLGECGAGVVWVGENGVRFYAGGRALTRSSDLVQAQATAWAGQRSRLDVAREMYRLRFPDEDPSGLTRRELLGREGQRVKRCYRRESDRTQVVWQGRNFVPGDFASSDALNQALTASAQCLYGIAHAVVAALGCSSGLGFIHSGHELSFVLDIADLYKTEVGIPVAFDAAREGEEDIASRTRRALRDRIHTTKLLDRCVADIQHLLGPYRSESSVDEEADQVALFTDGGEVVESGRNYGEADQ